MARLRAAGLTLLTCLAAAPALAQDDIGFPPTRPNQIAIDRFTDAHVNGLLETLDRLIALPSDPTKWANDAEFDFRRLTNRLQTAQLTDEQRLRVLAHFDGLAKKYPGQKAFIDKQRDIVGTRMIGQVAPDIVGKDLDNIEFKLSDYRGKVVVLYFTGEWCGPCRGEYPYQRLMLEVHKSRPFAIVGVNSDAKVDVAQQSKKDNRLEYRSWWDGYVEKKNTEGPIAGAWNVAAWPTVYILDAKGVIRYVHLRNEDVLKAVSQLLEELAARK